MLPEEDSATPNLSLKVLKKTDIILITTPITPSPVFKAQNVNN